MSECSPRRCFLKRLLITVAALSAFILSSVFSARIAVESLFRGVASSKSSALSSYSWDLCSMWSTGGIAGPYLQKGVADPWIARSANLLARSSAFDRSLASLHQIVSAHHGYLEDLRTESRFRSGRALAATISVPSNDFDATLSDLKTLGRVEGISEAGEDFAVKLATASRRLSAAQTNLRLTLLEDYRAPLQTSLAGVILQLRNSLVEGIASIFSSAALVLGLLF